MMSEQRKPETVIMEDEPTHTAQNGYECDDPECICHTAQQALREALDRPGKTVSREVAPGLVYKISVRKA
jgi:hypothetical protein